jgi:hypothetical protein
MGTGLSTTIKLEEHAFFILFVSLILMVFWHAVWELLGELTDYLHKRYGITKRNVYLISILVVILLVGIFPQILQKI